MWALAHRLFSMMSFESPSLMKMKTDDELYQNDSSSLFQLICLHHFLRDAPRLPFREDSLFVQTACTCWSRHSQRLPLALSRYHVPTHPWWITTLITQKTAGCVVVCNRGCLSTVMLEKVLTCLLWLSTMHLLGADVFARLSSDKRKNCCCCF